MRIVDAEPQLIEDLLSETDIFHSREHTDFTLFAGRHPTLGKLVVVRAHDGSGCIVETEE
jgi:hypothetical protein